MKTKKSVKAHIQTFYFQKYWSKYGRGYWFKHKKVIFQDFFGFFGYFHILVKIAQKSIFLK
jgi:hypothetical protein